MPWGVCSVALVLMDIGKVSMIALIANYLFEAIMFPTIFALSLSNLGNLTKSASSLLMMTPIGGCGFLLMGYLADTTNMLVPFVVPLVGYAVVLLFATYMCKQKLYVVKQKCTTANVVIYSDISLFYYQKFFF